MESGSSAQVNLGFDNNGNEQPSENEKAKFAHNGLGANGYGVSENLNFNATMDKSNEMETSNIDPIVVPQSQPMQYKMYKRRWIGMLAIVLLNLTTGLVWLSFTSVSEISQNWLNTSLSQVNLSAILYFIGSIVSSPLSGFVFEKWGIKNALLVGGVINCVGVWTRYGASFIHSSKESYELRLTLVLLGQFIAALSQPFFLNAPPKFAAVWFSDSSRAVAITIGTLSNPISAAMAMIVIPTLCKDKAGDDMPLTLLVIAITGLVALGSVFLMTSEPPTPPSPSAAIALAEAADEPFWISLKKTSSNRQFWILFIAFSSYAALFNAFSSLINQIVTPYGYDDDDAGVFGASLIGAGIFGAAISGILLDKYKIYKPVLRVCCPFVALGYVGLVFLVRKDGFVGLALICGLLGIFSFALLPVGLELGIECTYPCPPSTSTSLLWMGAQLFAVLFLVVGDALRDEEGDPPDNMRTALISSAGLACAGLTLVYLFNSPYYRMEAEARERQIENRATVQVVDDEEERANN